MGYLDPTSITVDAILTRKGREMLARGDGSFNITQFALSDDEIDYTLWNQDHPNGSAFSGEAIENLPCLEAFPDENQIMRNKLITLPRGTSKLPIITLGLAKITINIGGSTVVNPKTLNFRGLNSLSEDSGYSFTVSDRRLVSEFVGLGNNSKIARRVAQPFTAGALSQKVIGKSLSMTAINETSLFGTNTKLLTTLIVEGRDSGARVTIPVEISKNILGVTSTATVSGPVSS